MILDITQAFGHDHVSLLDGGLPRAVAEGIQLERGNPIPFKVSFFYIRIAKLTSGKRSLQNTLCLL